MDFGLSQISETSLSPMSGFLSSTFPNDLSKLAVWNIMFGFSGPCQPDPAQRKPYPLFSKQKDVMLLRAKVWPVPEWGGLDNGAARDRGMRRS